MSDLERVPSEELVGHDRPSPPRKCNRDAKYSAFSKSVQNDNGIPESFGFSIRKTILGRFFQTKRAVYPKTASGYDDHKPSMLQRNSLPESSAVESESESRNLNVDLDRRVSSGYSRNQPLTHSCHRSATSSVSRKQPSYKVRYDCLPGDVSAWREPPGGVGGAPEAGPFHLPTSNGSPFISTTNPRLPPLLRPTPPADHWTPTSKMLYPVGCTQYFNEH